MAATDAKSSRAGAADGVAARVERWIRRDIQQLEGYSVADATGMVKLDAMENPYVWDETMRRDWQAVLRSVELNRYPDPQAAAVKQRLCDTMGIPDSARVLLGNGSDELIQMIQTAVAGTDRCVVAPVPTFSMYQVIAATCGLKFIGVPLGPDFVLDAAAMRDAVRVHNPAAVFLAYPNNPTGNLFDRAAIAGVIAVTDGLVVLDEAYHPFSQESFMAELADFDNVVIMRTLSKSGLAGLRLGYLVGPPQWLQQLEKVRLPYNINSLTQVGATFALDRVDLFEEQARLIREQRELLFRELNHTPEIKAFPSHTNFILFRVADAPGVFNELKQAGILIKNLDQPGTALADCLRVTVGTPDEVQTFLSALRATVPS